MFDVGDRVRVAALNGRAAGQVAEVKILLITDLVEACRYQPRSEARFYLAACTFGYATQVLWMGADEPGHPTFYEMSEWRTIVNGFAVLFTPSGKMLDLDGCHVQLEKIDEAA